MGFIWFWLVAIMIVAYVILDGFDLGVGILQPLLARTDWTGRLCCAQSGRSGRKRSMADRGRRHTLLCVSTAVRVRLQRVFWR